MTAPSPKEALELLPCPFCGSSDVVCCDQGDDDFSVTCKSCGASSKFDDVESEAVKAWNTRAALATLPPAGERRESIARIVRDAMHDEPYYFDSFKERTEYRRERANKAADCILASGLMQNEAGWRDISTAPKDKIDGITARRVLLANTHGSMFIGYWSAEHDCWQDTSTHERVFSVATHWMPLPTPPIRSARNGGGS